jgi:imidazole glycerol phosphate synthase glutamine amidotransferase subunit
VKEVLIVPTGTANIASISAGIVRAGGKPAVLGAGAESPAARLARASHAVIPGVGTFGAAGGNIRSSGLEAAIRTRVKNGFPTLFVCVGFQLLFEASEESPGIEGLGLIAGRVERYRSSLVVPQMGWNRVESAGDGGLVHSGYGYFANSYCARSVGDGWSAARAFYGEYFVAAVERGPVVGCQFHPELSGSWGQDLLVRWLATGGGEEKTC